MTSSPKDIIAAVRRSHDGLASFVSAADGNALRRQSGCSEWNVAAVLSHLGSASEIALNTLLTGKADLDAAPAIWERWNGMSPEQQAQNFVLASGRLVEALAAQDDNALANRTLDLGFMPEPVAIGFYAGMRLSEMTLHRWDVDVAFDPAATLPAESVPLLLEQLPSFSRFFAKPTGTTGQVDIATSEPDGRYTIELGADGAALRGGEADHAGTRARMPGEALVRLISGRLAPQHTPASVAIDGDITLDDLRRTFPGY